VTTPPAFAHVVLICVCLGDETPFNVTVAGFAQELSVGDHAL